MPANPGRARVALLVAACTRCGDYDGPWAECKGCGLLLCEPCQADDLATQLELCCGGEEMSDRG